MNTMDKRQYNLRSKLVAAVAMLLISCIMMVSATYAWFTLSTAPEVQGITTTVGANGNLEIALSPYSGDAKDITSGMGDANLDWSAKNVTWGNLLNLSDNYVYGLDKIVLQPAQLVKQGDSSLDDKMTTNPLGYATYDSTGRPQVLAADTAIGSRYVLNDEGTYELTEGGRFEVTDTGFGVRVVGTSSDQSEWQSAFNTALSELVSGINSAKTKAQNSLNNHGGALAGIAITKGLLDNGAADYSEHVAELTAIVGDLKAANTELLNAIVNAIKAEAAANRNFNDTAYQASKNLAAEITAVEAAAAYLANDNIDAAIVIYKENADKISAAETALAACTGTVTLSLIRPVLTNIMDIDGNVTINGKTLTELAGMDTGAVASLLMGGVNIVLGDGSGLYADFGAAVGNLQARVLIPTFHYNGGDFSTAESPLYASMVTSSETVEGGYLPAYRADVAKVGAYVPAGNAETTTVIDSQLGYIVDFMFRTNASNSNLLLQTTPAQRVYEDSDSVATQGAGSTMTFTVDEDILSEEATRNLLECVRVVFFSPVDDTIYGIGILDGLNAVRVGNEITASLYLNEYSYSASGAVVAGDAIAEDDAILCALPANTATPVSALVYLEGEYVTNADVANGDVSLNGTLNLQFASDADLNPMDNTALKEMEGAGQYNAVLKVNGQTVRTAPVTAGTSYTLDYSTYVPAGTDVEDISVMMGDTDYTPASGTTISIGKVTGNIEVNVTLKTPETSTTP